MHLLNFIEEVAAMQKDIANKGKEEGRQTYEATCTQKGKVTD